MKERPILFSAPMVRALLAGAKTQTRRVMKAPWDMHAGRPVYTAGPDGNGFIDKPSPYGQPGDRLYVRETFSYLESFDYFNLDVPGEVPQFWYWADGDPTWGDWTKPKPSIHMPRVASRIMLEIVSVRVERLHDISEADAKAEGVICGMFGRHSKQATLTYAYKFLWEDINGAGSWARNPWVWVVEFRRIAP